MKRKIIEIDEALCNGCGRCITGCAEGALALVDGKARLVTETYCDGFGDCIGECPTGALRIVEREADEFDEKAVSRHLLNTEGPEAVRRMQAAGRRHGAPPSPPVGGCPGTRMQFRPEEATRSKPAPAAGLETDHVLPSDLSQWPVQLHLVQPDAPFFKNRELVVLSTCSPIASADVHWRFLRGRSVVVACPKLDNTGGYREKLTAIFAEPTLPAVQVVRMEVPCCGGLTRTVKEAAAQCGRTDLRLKEVTVSVKGDILQTIPVSIPRDNSNLGKESS